MDERNVEPEKVFLSFLGSLLSPHGRHINIGLRGDVVSYLSYLSAPPRLMHL